MTQAIGVNKRIWHPRPHLLGQNAVPWLYELESGKVGSLLRRDLLIINKVHARPHLDQLKLELIKILICIQSLFNILIIVFAIKYNLNIIAIYGQLSMLLVMGVFAYGVHKGYNMDALSTFVVLYYTLFLVPIVRYFLGPYHMLPVILALYTIILIIFLFERRRQWMIIGVYIGAMVSISIIDLLAVSKDLGFNRAFTRLVSMYMASLLIAISVLIFKKKFLDMSDKLYELTLKDTLTGAYNIRMLTQQLEDLTLKFEREHINYSLALIDLDDFKTINDTYGHDVGDGILCDFVDCVNKHLRENDQIARYGGDEFVIIFENCNTEKAGKIISKIFKDAYHINHPYDKKIFSFSAGVCDAKEAQGEGCHIFKLADRRMYLGKKSGKDKIVSQL